MTTFVGGLLNGVNLGGVLALIALGLVLAFRSTKTFNFAHGELMLLPAFVLGDLQSHQVSAGLSIPLSLVVGAIVGGLFYLLVLRRTIGLPLFMGIIATLGLAAILDGSIGIAFPAAQYRLTLPGIPSGTVTIWGATVSKLSVIVSITTFALALIVAGIIRFTYIGLKIRAASEDPILASQRGLQVRRLYLTTWAVTGVLAAIGGIAYGAMSSVNPSIVSLGLVAIPAIIFGGLDSIGGAVLGGLVFGLLRSYVQIYLGGQYVDPITYGSLLLVLLVFPQGLFGTRSVVRA